MAEQRHRRMRLFAPVADVIRGCLGKTRWGDEYAAQRAITRIKRENPDAMSSTVRPYRCPVCKKWHAGHGQ